MGICLKKRFFNGFMTYKVGYTQGVFDMFHIGHLNLLKNAKELCEYLIVGINSDDLVRNYKHKSPVIPEEERAEIVRNIKCVDEVQFAGLNGLSCDGQRSRRGWLTVDRRLHYSTFS